jgi:hypothetical protein
MTLAGWPNASDGQNDKIVTTQILSLLIVGLAFVIWRIARRILASYRHVDLETMREFWTQRLKADDPKEHQRVVDHLGLCEDCRQLLDKVREEKLIVENKRIDRRF